MSGTPQAPGVLDNLMCRFKKAWAAKRKHVYNFTSFIVLRSLALGTFAVSVPIFINGASANEYGIVAIGLSLLGLSTLLEVGIGYVITQSVGRRLARTGKSNPRLFNQLFWIYVGTTCMIAVTMAGILAFILDITSSQMTLYLWLAALLPCLATSGAIGAIFQAHNDLLYMNSSRFLFEIGKGLALAASGAFFHGSGAVGPIVFLFASVRMILDLYVLKRRYRYSIDLSKLSYKSHVFSLLAIGAPMFGSAALFLSVTIGDKLLIARLLGVAEVASYALAVDITTKAYLIVYAINSAIFALILRDHAVRKSISRFIAISLISVLFVSFAFYLPFGVFAEPLLSWWINADIGRRSASIAQVIAAAGVVYLVGNAFEVALLAMGRAKLVFLSYLCSVTTFFVSILIQLPALSLLSFGISYLAMSAIYALVVFAGYRHVMHSGWGGVSGTSVTPSKLATVTTANMG